MSLDFEIMKKAWEGKITVLFFLSPDDHFIGTPPDPVFLGVVRGTYFPSLLETHIHTHFKNYVNPSFSFSDIWLEDEEGAKVKWHWPLGVLYDLYCLKKKSVPIPWKLIVHYQNFPEDELLRFGSEKAIRVHLMTGIKEADCLRAKGNNFKFIEKSDVDKLIESIKNVDFNSYLGFINKLKIFSLTLSENFRFIPVKIHFPKHHLIQKLISPQDKKGSPHLLVHLFKLIFTSDKLQKAMEAEKINLKESEVFGEVKDSNKSLNSPDDGETGDEEEESETKLEFKNKLDDADENEKKLASLCLSQEEKNQKSELEIENSSTFENSLPSDDASSESNLIDCFSNLPFLIQGVKPPLSTPLLWLSQHLSYPDNFLHICVDDPL